MAGVDRVRLAVIEAGQPARVSTIGAIEAVPDRLEDENGDGWPDTAATNHSIRIRLTSAHGLHVELEGPVSTLGELEASAARLVRCIAANHGCEPR